MPLQSNSNQAYLPGSMKSKDVPRLNNFCDCGAFMEEFLKDPDKTTRCHLQKKELEWDIRPRDVEIKIRDLLLHLPKEQQVRLAEEQARKRATAPLCEIR
jgi:hypothetical protein